MTKQNSIFAKDFTNLYELSKTLRFELKPIGNTQKMIEGNSIFEEDKKRQESYEKIKPVFDELHREFVLQALSKAGIFNFEEYEKEFKKYQKILKKDLTEKDKKNFVKIQDKLRKEVVDLFNLQAEEWSEVYGLKTNTKFKKPNLELLTDKSVMKILKYKCENEEIYIEFCKVNDIDLEIFEEFNNFFGYFEKFNETRKNFYTDKDQGTAIANRIINENLKFFMKNKFIYEENQEIYKDIGLSEEEKNIFSSDFYKKCFLQEGIDKYNEIIGGKLDTQKNINEKINEYRQRQDKGTTKIPFIKQLYKQILSEKDKQEAIIIENDKNLFVQVNDFYERNVFKENSAKNFINNFFTNFSNFDLNGIYISKIAINTISNKFFANWGVIQSVLLGNIGEKDKNEKGRKKMPDFVSLKNLETALNSEEVKDIDKNEFWKKEIKVNENKNNFENFCEIFLDEFNNCFDESSNNLEILKKSNFYKNQKFFAKKSEKEKEVEILKNYLDATLNVNRMMKYFLLEKSRESVAENYSNVNDEFYEKGLDIYCEDDQVFDYYNAVRNYITKKPYSEEKIKLNFKNSTLGGGWAKSKEKDNFCVILKKNENFYLGIVNKTNNTIFENEKFAGKFRENIEDGFYEKMNYNQLSKPYLDLPGATFPKKGGDQEEKFNEKKEEFTELTKEILEIKNDELYKIGNTEMSKLLNIPKKELKNHPNYHNLYNERKKCMVKLIDYFKHCLSVRENWQCYDFQFKNSEEYNNIGEFYSDVSAGSYSIDFSKISEKYICEKNKNGELYLFQIYNKDFDLDESYGKEKYGESFKKKANRGVENLHTMYFKELFSSQNLAENPVIYKLNGGAEIFKRPKTEKLEKLENGNVKNFRYSEDKYLFHLPISLNAGKGDYYGFNQNINNFLANNFEKINIMGIDRGEKHLAYYSVIDKNGKVLLDEKNNSISGSFNEINKKDYGEILQKRTDEMGDARKTWKQIGKIKELKDGYISQIVRKIADLMIKYNAIVVFEDLNMGFKNSRKKIEKQVYQKLEKALIEKLNYLVFKKDNEKEKQIKNLLNAFQLTSKFETFEKMGKQTGMIFYTQADYTSTTDPTTGWRKNIYISNSATKEKLQEFFAKIDILWNGEYFEFTYDLKDFESKKKKNDEILNKTKWTVCSCVDRFRWGKNKNKKEYLDGEIYLEETENTRGGYTKYEMTKVLKSFFAKHLKWNDSIEDVSSLIKEKDSNFYKSLVFYWNLILQIRNTNQNEVGNENDFIQSSVAPFFDSRNNNNVNLPKNGDDNGALNIAKKGIIILEKIKEWNTEKGNCEKLSWKDLYISNTEWDNFTQEKFDEQ